MSTKLEETLIRLSKQDRGLFQKELRQILSIPEIRNYIDLYWENNKNRLELDYRQPRYISTQLGQNIPSSIQPKKIKIKNIPNGSKNIPPPELKMFCDDVTSQQNLKDKQKEQLLLKQQLELKQNVIGDRLGYGLDLKSRLIRQPTDSECLMTIIDDRIVKNQIIGDYWFILPKGKTIVFNTMTGSYQVVNPVQAEQLDDNTPDLYYCCDAVGCNKDYKVVYSRKQFSNYRTTLLKIIRED